MFIFKNSCFKTDMATDEKQFYYLALFQFIISFGLFSVIIYYGNVNNINYDHHVNNDSTKCSYEITSPNVLLSKDVMGEFMFKLPVNGQQLSKIIIYKGHKVIGEIPERRICSLRT